MVTIFALAVGALLIPTEPTVNVIRDTMNADKGFIQLTGRQFLGFLGTIGAAFATRGLANMVRPENMFP